MFILYIKNFNSTLFIPTDDFKRLDWAKELNLFKIKCSNMSIKNPDIFYKENNIAIFMGYDKNTRLYLRQFILLIKMLGILEYHIKQKQNYHHHHL